MQTFAATVLLAVACTACGDDPAPAKRSPVPRAALSGSYFIVDVDARQDGVDGFPGCVFKFEPELPEGRRLTRFAADPRFVDPEQLVITRDGAMFLVDAMADPEKRGGRHGAVFELDPKSGKVTRAFAPRELAMPVSIVELGPGKLAIADRFAPDDGSDRHGSVLSLDVATGKVTALATDPAFRAPAFVVVDHDGSLVLLDADTKSRFSPAEGVLFRIDPEKGGVTRIGDLEGTVSPLTLLPEPDGQLLVFDVNADPMHFGGPAGGVFRFDPASGKTTLVAGAAHFRDPVRGCFAPDGSVVFVDANADVEKTGPDPKGRGQNATGPGAVFKLDREHGTVTFVDTFPEFVNPVDICRAPEPPR